MRQGVFEVGPEAGEKWRKEHSHPDLMATAVAIHGRSWWKAPE